MNRNSIFWKIFHGELPIPKAAQTLGMEIQSVDSNQGTINVSFQAKEEFTNPAGNVQGGFISAMLDETVSPALLAMLEPDQFAVTLELKTQFIAPASTGKIEGVGKVVSRSNRICFLEGELLQEGKCIARATATSMIQKLA